MKSMLIPAVALVFATAACSGNKDDATGADATATDTAAMGTTATPTATDTAAATPAAAFLTDAIQTDNAEIKAGQAAQDMGSTQGVKDFGKMLVDDHTKHKDQASTIAMAMNVPVPEGTPPGADEELKMATGMKGSAFDKDFLAMMVKGHQAAIDKFQKEADSSDPAQLTDFAKQSLPTLKKHLQTAQSLQK
jgi:putative membrane protein